MTLSIASERQGVPPWIRASLAARADASRRGALLLLVAGMVCMIVMLAVAFLVRMRGEAQQADVLLRTVQCRVMLHAAMAYLCEASRLGYARMNADGTCQDPREGWGWIDPRDPSEIGVAADITPGVRGAPYLIGPRDRTGAKVWTGGGWPALGSHVRAPMFAWKRPPFAVESRMCQNPIPTDAAVPETFGIPFLVNVDPRPVTDDTAPAYVPASPTTADQRALWVQGDSGDVPGSNGLAWFRIYRETGSEPDRPGNAGPVGATFVVTTGAGGTMGFMDWAEVVGDSATDLFANSQGLFEILRSGELRRWYRVEWSPAVGGGELDHYIPYFAKIDENNPGPSPPDPGKLSIGRQPNDTWTTGIAINYSRTWGEEIYCDGLTTPEPRNYGGTIRYIQRLLKSPGELVMRHAFTLIEVLVVITIITLLTGMMILGSSAMMRGAKSQKTSAILTIVLQGLELQRMERGGALAPAEHPLAGSAEPRFAFTRGAATLASAGLALTGVAAATLPAAFQPRLLLPDDRFADARVPALFGVRRGDIGVLGASLKDVQRYRRLPQPSSASAVIADPDDVAMFPDADRLVSSRATPGDSSQAVQFALNRGNALSELQKLGALSEADESRGVPGAGGRVWIPPEAATGGSSWKGSTFVDPGTGRRSGYRLRGIAIYDAWGREILYSLAGNGVIRLTSSGPDGCFRIDPGLDGTFDTAVDATTMSGDDKDGARDNVQLVAGGDLR